jgi:anhydro-N-acetylmuramic acid kinase
MPYAIGLNSGSSFDGVDAVLVDIALAKDGSLEPPRFVHGLSLDWPEDVRNSVLAAFSNDLSLFELTRLNYIVGAVFAEAAMTLMKDRALQPADVDVIGYDGQTVYQEPPEHTRMAALPDTARPYERWSSGGYPCGMQIGEPGVVAVLANVPTVTQFRSVDHALGGTGAPLMQFLDYVVFRGIAPIATLNIGGISNLQVANEDRARMQAFDCGPGNVMIDHAMAKFFGERYDAGGAVAATGRVDTACLSELNSHPFFTRAIPRCAWRLDFGGDYADAMMAKYAHVAPADLVATFTQFTASAIIRSLVDHVQTLNEIKVLVASGGGTRNTTLMRLLREQLPPHVSLVLSDEYGLPSQYKEAIKFATLAFATLHGVANNIPAASGARAYGVLGKLVLPPRSARQVPDPA